MGVVPSLETRDKIRATKVGTYNPNFGKVSTNALPVNVYDTVSKETLTFKSRIALKNYLGADYKTINNAIKSRKLYKKRYLIFIDEEKRPLVKEVSAS